MWAVVGATIPFLSSLFQFFVYKLNLFSVIYLLESIHHYLFL